MRLVALAPAKINLCLFLGPGRPDGRHELVTLFESVSLADSLSLSIRDSGSDEVVCPGIEGPDLAEQALAELRRSGWDAPPVRVEITKRIPVAAGMGGGSADAAAMLRLASELAPGRPEELFDIAASLGADVPSQLAPGVALGTGAGDMVEPYAPLSEHALVVLPADLALSTADVYREADALGLGRSAEELRRGHEQLVGALAPGARLPDELLVNDLQAAAISLCPDIELALRAARDAGAEEALVCGSGPTVFGVFWGGDGERRAQAAAEQLRSAYPAVVTAAPVQSDFGMPRVA